MTLFDAFDLILERRDGGDTLDCRIDQSPDGCSQGTLNYRSGKLGGYIDPFDLLPTALQSMMNAKLSPPA